MECKVQAFSKALNVVVKWKQSAEITPLWRKLWVDILLKEQKNETAPPSDVSQNELTSTSVSQTCENAVGVTKKSHNSEKGNGNQQERQNGEER